MLKNNIEQFARNIVAQHPQCAPWLENYTTDFETQINIDSTGLEPRYLSLTEQRGWFDAHGYTHNHIRLPYNASSNPTWRDREVFGPIHERWTLFGTSGWNWAEKKSYWVGFDFDSVANHAEGLTPDQMEEVKLRALSLPYVTARTSKSGKGIHLLVYLDPRPTTRNHNEHASLAKHVLGQMSHDTGFNFHGSADCCGLILWHWTKGLNDDCCKNI